MYKNTHIYVYLLVKKMLLYLSLILILTCKLAFNASPYNVGLCVKVGLLDCTPLVIQRVYIIINIFNFSMLYTLHSVDIPER